MDKSYFTVEDVKDYMKENEDSIKSFCGENLSKSILMSEIIIALILYLGHMRNNGFVFEPLLEKNSYYSFAGEVSYIIELLKSFLSSKEEEFFLKKEVKENYKKLIVDNNYISQLEELRLDHINFYLSGKIKRNIIMNLLESLNSENLYNLLNILYGRTIYMYKDNIIQDLKKMIEIGEVQCFIEDKVGNFFNNILEKYLDNNSDMASSIIEKIDWRNIDIRNIVGLIETVFVSNETNIDGDVIKNILFSQGNSMLLYQIYKNDTEEDIKDLEYCSYVERRINDAFMRM